MQVQRHGEAIFHSGSSFPRSGRHIQTRYGSRKREPRTSAQDRLRPFAKRSPVAQRRWAVTGSLEIMQGIAVGRAPSRFAPQMKPETLWRNAVRPSSRPGPLSLENGLAYVRTVPRSCVVARPIWDKRHPVPAPIASKGPPALQPPPYKRAKQDGDSASPAFSVSTLAL